jgi:hypothetical protein
MNGRNAETSQAASISIKKPSFNHWRIHTEITIHATPEQVWSVLTDTQSMKDWSHSIVLLGGEIKAGRSISVNIQPFSALNVAKRYEHTLFAEEGSYFGWNDTRVLGAHDNHQFALQAQDDFKTRFVHTDELIGGMAWLIGDFKMNFLKGLYARFNRELKSEVERRFSPP